MARSLHNRLGTIYIYDLYRWYICNIFNDIYEQGDNAHNILRRFVHVFILVNLYWGLIFCCVVTDVNECANNNGNCHSQAKCTNTPGSFTCTCLDGYSGDGITCSGDEWTITVLYFTFLHKLKRPIRTLVTICYPLVLVLRNTKYIIQLIINYSWYCGDNHVLSLVYFPFYLRLNTIYIYGQGYCTIGLARYTQTIYIHDICNKTIICDIQCESKKTPTVFWNFFPNGWEFLINFLHTYYTIISTLEYKFLFNYLRFWRSYAILSATTQFT